MRLSVRSAGLIAHESLTTVCSLTNFVQRQQTASPPLPHHSCQPSSSMCCLWALCERRKTFPLPDCFCTCRTFSSQQSGTSFSQGQTGCMGMRMASMCQTSQMVRSTSTGLMAQSIMGNGGTVNPTVEAFLWPCQVSGVITTTTTITNTAIATTII